MIDRHIHRLRHPSLGLGLKLGLSGGSGIAVPALDLNFLSGALDSRITFTRGSAGWRFNASGLYESVATNLPRFDYDPATLAAKGLLIEEQRTNLLLHNRDLTNAAWTASNVTAAKTATGIDGASNSASTITATAGNGTILQSVTSASAARSSTAWIKRRTGSGTIQMTQDNGSTWAAVTATADWTRVSIASATVTNPIYGFRIVTSGDAVDVDFCQMESGSIPTSAIETAGSQVTRSRDDVSITSSNFSHWFNQSEGTFLAELSYFGSGINRRVLVCNDGTANEEHLLSIGTGEGPAFLEWDGAILQANLSTPAVAPGTLVRMAAAYKENDFALCANAGSVSADSSGTVCAPNQLNIGREISSTFLNGHIRRVAYYTERLVNSEMQRLTS